MLAKIFRSRNAVHITSQLQWVERDIYCSSCFHTSCPLVSRKMKAIFRNYIGGPSFLSQVNETKVSLLTTHQNIKIMKLTIWKITLKAFALIVPLHPFFQYPQHIQGERKALLLTLSASYQSQNRSKLLQKNSSKARNL